MLGVTPAQAWGGGPSAQLHELMIAMASRFPPLARGQAQEWHEQLNRDTGFAAP
jgi:hypothetical protein